MARRSLCILIIALCCLLLSPRPLPPCLCWRAL
jgi:hypothetical protein